MADNFVPFPKPLCLATIPKNSCWYSETTSRKKTTSWSMLLIRQRCRRSFPIWILMALGGRGWMGWMGSLGIEWPSSPPWNCEGYAPDMWRKHKGNISYSLSRIYNIPTKPKRTSSGDSIFYDTPLVLLDMVVEWLLNLFSSNWKLCIFCRSCNF